MRAKVQAEFESPFFPSSSSHEHVMGHIISEFSVPLALPPCSAHALAYDLDDHNHSN